MVNRIGPYEIKAILGKGGMGTVYRALDPTVNREVAIKVINPELSQNLLLMKRFQNEAIAMARLNHPNIVALYNFFSEGNLHYIVMEFVQGKSLSQILREEGALPCDRALFFFTQILAAIDYAHRQGIIHRDIKPSNFIAQPNGVVKVTDFGVAKVFGGEELTRAGTVLGTSHYMSPEQILAQPISTTSDIYSLGITLYEMVTGRVPFSGNSDFEIQRCHLELSPSPPRRLNPNVPQAIEKAILTSIEKKPENRFPTVTHFIEVLSGAAGIQDGLTSQPWNPLPSRSWGRGRMPQLGQWLARYQSLPTGARWMVLLMATLLFILFLMVLFSISSKSLV
jgi:eukaryotic-like serine/threonine-protein kinase